MTDLSTRDTSGAGFELHGPITPVRTLVSDLWRSRELLRMLSRRDFYVRYRRPTFGFLWAIGLPLMNAIVLSVVFSRVVRVHTDVNYPTFVMAATLPWVFFASTLTSGTTSITSGSSIASKVYFPRALLPLVTMLANFYGFVPGLALIIVFALIFHVPLGVSLLVLVPAVAALLLLTSGFVLVLAALNVYLRDVAFIVSAVLQAWFYGSAIIYPVSFVPKGILRTLVELNPATGMIGLFRMSIFGTAPSPFALAALVGWIVVLLVIALLLYRRYDRVFVDLL
jgi:lipopolysaccharide transport system permease protein